MIRSPNARLTIGWLYGRSTHVTSMKGTLSSDQQRYTIKGPYKSALIEKMRKAYRNEWLLVARWARRLGNGLAFAGEESKRFA